MKAFILAAGLGERLRPLTDHKPKALVKVAGMTMLERTIRNLASSGFRSFVVNVHYYGEQIFDFLADNDNFVYYINMQNQDLYTYQYVRHAHISRNSFDTKQF